MKKSPSPTGNKSPPGYPLSSNNGTVGNDESIGTDEYTQRKPLIAQVSKNINKRGIVLLRNFFNGGQSYISSKYSKHDVLTLTHAI